MKKVLWVSLIASWAVSLVFVFVMWISFNMVTEQTRQRVVADAYHLEWKTSEMLKSRADRLQEHLRIAKTILLKEYPKMTLSDDELTQLLIDNFDQSERLGVSPWIALAFVSVESQFVVRAQSTVEGQPGARGLFQLMPSTARLVLDSEYYDGCEYVPRIACRVFYRILTSSIELYNGKLEWVAAAYYSGHIAQRYYLAGYTVQGYMQRFEGLEGVSLTYPTDILNRYNYYLEASSALLKEAGRL